MRVKKSILLHYSLAIILAILVVALTYMIVKLFPNIGYGILTFAYSFIFIGLICYYAMTTYYNAGFTILSFLLNFILWVAEQVNLEKLFQDTFVYRGTDFGITVTVLGGLLWTTNKLLLDRGFSWLNIKSMPINQLDRLL
jgi:predicted neutral ceramidase superfamily lipid hydrolase